ncbi:MAG: ABC transporter substrate-binding protein [Chthoniobacteraceae bacterium]
MKNAPSGVEPIASSRRAGLGVLAGAALLLVLAGVLLPFRAQPKEGREPASPPLHHVRDLAGREVALKPEIRRIVLVQGRDIYALAALLGDDLPNRLVAIGPDLRTADHDAYEAIIARYPSIAKLPEIGDVFKDALSAEQLIELQPDLVVLDAFMLERGCKCLAKLEQAGLPLVYHDASNDPISGPQRSLLLLGSLLGPQAEARAREMAGIADARIALITSRLASYPGPFPSVYLETGGNPHRPGNTFGTTKTPPRYTCWGEVLHRLRVQNIADGVIDWGPLHPETILRADPEVVIVTGQSWKSPGQLHLGYGADAAQGMDVLAEFRTRPGWASLRAMQSGRIYAVFHTFTIHFFGYVGIEAIAKDCYPGLFADLNPEADLREIHNRYLPYPLTGAWMLPTETP